MYQVRALSLTKDDLWSKGVIQKVYLDDTEIARLFCLGVTKANQWEPLRIQGKIGYAYSSEAYAQEICARQAYSQLTSANRYRQAIKLVVGRAAMGLLHAIWANLVP